MIKLTKKEEEIRNKLEKAIDYFVEYTPIEELIEHIKWYNAEDIYDLKNIMFESYLDGYQSEELEQRIKMLYEIDKEYVEDFEE